LDLWPKGFKSQCKLSVEIYNKTVLLTILFYSPHI